MASPSPVAVLPSMPRKRSDARPRPGSPAGVVGGRGGQPNIMPPTNSMPRRTGGEDWFETGWYVDWDTGSWGDLVSFLDSQKERAQDGEAIFTLRGQVWRVSPTGVKVGEGALMRWRLEHVKSGVIVMIQRRAQRHETMPNVLSRATSMSCMTRGAWACTQIVRHAVEALGGRIRENVLSRVDACVDLPGVRVDEFVQRFIAFQYVTRARKGEAFGVARDGRKHTGFSIGKGIRLTVYDKLLETDSQIEKRAVVRDLRWAGQDVDAATRVEFRLRRDALKGLGVQTVEDWFGRRSSICRYLCEKWFRMTEGDVDRTNTTRAPLWSVWQRVADMFDQWTCEEIVSGGGAVVVSEADAESLTRQAVGCVEAALLSMRRNVGSVDEFLREMLGMVSRVLDTSPTWAELYARRLKSLPELSCG